MQIYRICHHLKRYINRAKAEKVLPNDGLSLETLFISFEVMKDSMLSYTCRLECMFLTRGM